MSNFVALQTAAQRIQQAVIFIKKTVGWLKAVLIWLFKEWVTFWYGAFPLLVIISLPILLPSNNREDVIRYAGLTLQVLGIVIVVFGIDKTLKDFDYNGIVGVFMQRMSRFPRYSTRTHCVDISAELPALNLELNATGHDVRGTSMEARVQELKNNLKMLEDRMGNMQKEIRREFGKHQKALEDEINARLSNDQDISRRLKSAHTGSLGISAVGAGWLFFGVILSTIPHEINESLIKLGWV
jgi:hypothetical protein